MKITLAQSDIVEALHSHIIGQGISLDGKTVDIKFTMKKGNAGVFADVSIEAGLKLPDLSGDDVVVQQRPQLAVVADNTAVDVKVDAAVEVAEQPAVVATGTEDAAGAPASKTTSLFNSN